MNWYVAESLEVLRKQINAAAPHRDLSSDGGIGNAEHASRSSDHNPWVMDGNQGVVRARDFTHDPADGMDAEIVANAIRLSGDKRVDYIIWNHHIANPGEGWRAYNGANPHTHHFHVSVDTKKALYNDTSPWKIGLDNASIWTRTIAAVTKVVAPKPLKYPLLVKGSKGDDVKKLQTLLKIKVDGDFGPKTSDAVVSFQKAKKLVADGKVGTYTWVALGA